MVILPAARFFIHPIACSGFYGEVWMVFVEVGKGGTMRFLVFITTLFLTWGALYAQEETPSGDVALNSRFTAMKLGVQAFKFPQNRTTSIELTGSALMPKAEGSLEIDTAGPETKITVHVRNLKPAWSLDPTKLTYILWALAPNEINRNLGELKLKDGKANLATSTNLRTFSIILTAEPYFAVKEPSRYAVMFNVSRPRAETALRADLLPIRPDSRTPLEISEARNAVRIARQSGAEHYAADILRRALQLLQQAEDVFQARKGEDTRGVEEKAREATAVAEDARSIAEQRQPAGDLR